MTSLQMQADKPTFAIIVTEKGGGERREVFQTGELSVGRVQGNELTLPKGNVSKRHARLLLRDGRFIITDLNSTNGTYVNRRRISQATIVRDGDRIYIGDFVLRLEPATEEDTESMREAQGKEVGQRVSVQPSRPMVSLRAAGPRNEGHSPSAHGKVSSVPAGVEVRAPATIQPSLSAQPDPAVEAEENGRGDAAAQDEESQARQRRSDALHVPELPEEEVTLSATQRALRLLIERVHESLAPGALEKDVDERLAARFLSILQEQFEDLLQDGEFPPDIPGDRILADARAELLELGPVTRLLEESAVREVRVLRFDRVQAVYDDRVEQADVGFTSNGALVRAIRRLCRKSGTPLQKGEQYIQRTLPDGIDAVAVMGSLAPAGAALSVRRREFARETFAELVECEMLSAAMARFLEQVLAGGLRVLVVGSPSSAASPVVSALCRAGASESLAAMVNTDDWVIGHPAATKLNLRHEGVEFTAMLALARRLAARVVVDLSDSEHALDAIFDCGFQPMTAFIPDLSVEQALARLVPLIGARRAGLAQATAASLVAASFDLVVEVTRLPDGVSRVTRIAELLGNEGDAVKLNEVFFYEFSKVSGAAASAGFFKTARNVPRLAAQLSLRGIDFDESQFGD